MSRKHKKEKTKKSSNALVNQGYEQCLISGGWGNSAAGLILRCFSSRRRTFYFLLAAGPPLLLPLPFPSYTLPLLSPLLVFLFTPLFWKPHWIPTSSRCTRSFLVSTPSFPSLLRHPTKSAASVRIPNDKVFLVVFVDHIWKQNGKQRQGCSGIKWNGKDV